MTFSIKALVASFAFLFLPYAFADTQGEVFSKTGTSVFVITKNNNKTQIRLDISIANWQIDCTKSRAVIWGKTLKKLPTGVAPYTKIYVVNILKKRVLHSHTRTLRVYGVVEFDKDSEIIIVDEDLIDFKSGALKQVESAPVFEKENCPDFQGRRLSL
jgi:hypothetical protein